MTAEERAAFGATSYVTRGERQPELLDDLRQWLQQGVSGAAIIARWDQRRGPLAGPGGDNPAFVRQMIAAAIGYMPARQAAGQPF
jgi:hypothetical protein